MSAHLKWKLRRGADTSGQRVQSSVQVIIAPEVFGPSNDSFRGELREEKKAKKERSPPSAVI